MVPAPTPPPGPARKPNFNPPGQGLPRGGTAVVDWPVAVRDTGRAPRANLRPCEYCGRTYHLHETCDGCGAAVQDVLPPPKPRPPQNRIEYRGQFFTAGSDEDFAKLTAEIDRRCERDHRMVVQVFLLVLALLALAVFANAPIQ